MNRDILNRVLDIILLALGAIILSYSAIILLTDRADGVLFKYPELTVYFVLTGLFLVCLLFRVVHSDRQMDINKNLGSIMKNSLLKRGPKIVAIGGGSGLSSILRSLKRITSNNTAIVTVTDDGGSSGRLIKNSVSIPPGDIRNCIVALSPKESTMEDLFNYRFSEPSELAGHNLGNLLIAGLIDIKGDTALAVRGISQILDICGTVLPVTMDSVGLVAKMKDGKIINGETAIVDNNSGIDNIWLEPDDCKPNQEAIDAILDADKILLGPGSLYTSIIPNLLVPGIVDALIKTKAPVYYIANIMTQPGETDNYDLSDHINAINYVVGTNIIDTVVINSTEISNSMKRKYRANGSKPVKYDKAAIKANSIRLIQLSMLCEDEWVKHDATKLAELLSLEQ